MRRMSREADFNGGEVLWIAEAEYLDDYEIRLEFSDGREGVVNLREMIMSDHRPIVRQLEDVELFKNFQLVHDTITWPNDLDLAPEYLYFQSFKDDPELMEQFQEWGYMA